MWDLVLGVVAEPLPTLMPVQHHPPAKVLTYVIGQKIQHTYVKGDDRATSKTLET